MHQLLLITHGDKVHDHGARQPRQHALEREHFADARPSIDHNNNLAALGVFAIVMVCRVDTSQHTRWHHRGADPTSPTEKAAGLLEGLAHVCCVLGMHAIQARAEL